MRPLADSFLPQILLKMENLRLILGYFIFLIVVEISSGIMHDLTVIVPPGRRECFHQTMKTGFNLEFEFQASSSSTVPCTVYFACLIVGLYSTVHVSRPRSRLSVFSSDLVLSDFMEPKIIKCYFRQILT